MPLAAGATLQDCLLTSADIVGLNTKRHGLTDAVLNKLETALDLLKSSHNIDPATYPLVLSTSDVHADLCKLHHVLKGIGVIEPDTHETIDNIMANEIKPQIFSKSQSKWLLVIVGDIVDGQRINNKTGAIVGEVADDRGNVELLLHAYLYNLRIRARMIGCEIRFTVGNHDMATVIDAPHEGSREFYAKYVHGSAQAFFGNFENRRRCLLPFYDCCPYFLVTVGQLMAFVHGGLHNNDGTFAYEQLKAVQEKVDDTGHLGTITDAEVLSSVANSEPQNKPLWSRIYSKGVGEGLDNDVVAATACAVVKSANPFKLTVVGHCPTDNNPDFGHHTHIMEDPAYAGCGDAGEGGCVLLGCADDTDRMPRVAFVDITMSSAFRDRLSWQTERARRAQMLVVAIKDNEIYSITRLGINYSFTGARQKPTPIVVWTQPPKPTGGRRTLRARRGYRKTR